MTGSEGNPTMAPGPLDGVRVLEFTQIIAGPLAGSVLADLGADVVKIEPPGGAGRGPAGAPPAANRMFQFLNRGKRSLVVDLGEPEGRALIHRIVPSFDVVIINYRPAVIRRLEIDYDTLSQFRPDLIYAQISGFGSHGPRVDEPLIDMVAQAYSGYMAEVGVVDEFGGPMGTHGGTIDAATGLSTVVGVSSALYHRAESGEGQFIDVALLRSAMILIGALITQEPDGDSAPFDSRVEEARERYAQGADYASVLRGYKTTRPGLARPGEGRATAEDPATDERVVVAHSSIRGPFLAGYMAKDGPVFIGAYTPVMRTLARQALDIADDGSDEPGVDPFAPDVLARVARTRQAVVEAVGSRTVDELLRELLAAGVPVGPVYLPGEVGADPQAAELMVQIEDEVTGPQRQLGGVFEMSKSAVGPAGPAPALAQHTDEVLREAGLSAGEIAALRDTGAVA